MTDVALGAADGDDLSGLEALGGCFRADHRRNPELARDDRRVAGAPAAIGDDGGGAFHHRAPVGSGDVRDEDLAGLEAVELRAVVEDAHGAGCDLAAHGSPGDRRLGSGRQPVVGQLAHVALGGHRLGPGLHDVEVAVERVLGPFDVHGAVFAGAGRVVLLDAHGAGCQLQDLLVADAEAPSPGLGRGDVGRAPGRAPVSVDHPDLLVAETAAEDRAGSVLEGRLVDVELVGIDGTLHDVLAEAVGGGHEDHVAEGRVRVEREQNAARRLVGAHHLHHPDRQRHLEVIEAVVDAIADTAVGEQAREAALTGIDERLATGHVQVGLVLAGEAGRRQVFRRSRSS